MGVEVVSVWVMLGDVVGVVVGVDVCIGVGVGLGGGFGVLVVERGFAWVWV